MQVTASRGVKLVADCAWHLVSTTVFDVLIIPGGAAGVERLLASDSLLNAVRAHVSAGRLTGAICAGPLVLDRAGVLAGKSVTSHPSVFANLQKARWINRDVVVDGNLVTSQGAGTALAFALELLVQAQEPDTAIAIAMAMIIPLPSPAAQARRA